MELLNALLAGFFYWLLGFHWQRKVLARRRENAGALLLRVDAAPDALRGLRWELLFGCTMLMWLVFMVTLMASSRTQPLALHFVIAIQFGAALGAVVPITFGRTALEVREHGLIQRAWGFMGRRGLFGYMPWKDMKSAKWVPKFKVLGAHSLWAVEMSEDLIAPDQRAAVTAAMGRFVPVYGTDGTLLAEPKPAAPGAKAPPERRPDRSMFQFDLQFVMILTVVVACAANCYGLRYRRLLPIREALVKLAAFGPQQIGDEEDLISLDFSNCQTKPGDDDLAILRPLVALRSVYLTGAPITDAGLAHLARLKSLRTVSLKDTRVTAQGAEELYRALPETSIIYGPSSATRRLSPADRQ